MKNFIEWIKNHQVVAFFIIAFVISWGLAFSWDAVLNRDQGLLLPLAFVSACGPGLAGIIVSAVINTQPKQGSRKAFWIALLVAFCAYLPRQLYVHGRAFSLTGGDHHFRSFSFTGSFYYRLGLLPDTICEKLSSLVAPFTWSVGMGATGIGIASCPAVDFYSR